MTEEQEKRIRDAALVYYDMGKCYDALEIKFIAAKGDEKRSLVADIAVSFARMKEAETTLRLAQGLRHGLGDIPFPTSGSVME